jgi:pimeloyl-ACP methyl ester carboxylesterase
VPPYRIHSLEFGAGEETVVLLHGLSGSARWWSRNVPALARFYRVLVPDLVGFGRTRGAGPVPGMDEAAELLAGWLTALGVERTHLIGHSMGGQVSIHLASLHPERLSRLVLADASGLRRLDGPARLARFAMEAAPLWKWGDPRFLPTILVDAVAAGPRSIVRGLTNILGDDVTVLLPGLRVPTLLLWGEHDHLVPLEDAVAMRRAIPGARLAVIRGAGHNPMVDRPAAFDRLVLRFLRGADVGH